MAPPDPRGPALGSLGQVYVTLAAARTYAAARGLLEEEARRELTERLLEAHQKEAESGAPELWRYRSRAGGLDISARVSREGPLLVIVSISVRRY